MGTKETIKEASVVIECLITNIVGEHADKEMSKGAKRTLERGGVDEGIDFTPGDHPKIFISDEWFDAEYTGGYKND